MITLAAGGEAGGFLELPWHTRLRIHCYIVLTGFVAQHKLPTVDDLIERCRPPQQIPLDFITSFALEQFKLSFRLDAFGQYRDRKALA